MNTRICEFCGAPYEPVQANQRFCCTSHQIENSKQAAKEKRKEIAKAKKLDRFAELNEIAREARLRGMSYGQYVAMLYKEGAKIDKGETKKLR